MPCLYQSLIEELGILRYNRDNTEKEQGYDSSLHSNS